VGGRRAGYYPSSDEFKPKFNRRPVSALRRSRQKPVTWGARSRLPIMLSFTPLGRSAAELISINKRFPSSCVPLDRLLGDGLPAGHVLELSGPPGTAKETLAIKVASGAVSSDDQVLFVGRAPIKWPIFPSHGVLDMQNMASPSSLRSELRTPRYYWTRPRFTLASTRLQESP
jgi:hypothetical protein